MSISTPLKGDGNGHYRIKIVGNSGTHEVELRDVFCT